MPELARTIVSRLRAYIGNRRRAKRRLVQLPFSVTPADRRLSSNGSAHPASIEGHTIDISASGLALNVPAIRIGEHYLVGDNRRLLLVLQLPVGPVQMQVTPVRYEGLEEHDTNSGYLIGVQITEMSERDREAYDEFVHRLLNEAPLD
jgi:hypothetical protein